MSKTGGSSLCCLKGFVSVSRALSVADSSAATHFKYHIQPSIL